MIKVSRAKSKTVSATAKEGIGILLQSESIASGAEKGLSCVPFLTAMPLQDGLKCYGTNSPLYFLPCEQEKIPPAFFRRCINKLYRFLEILVSFIILFLTLPLMVSIGAIIKKDSPGPVLFIQRRFGKSSRMSGKDLLRSREFIILEGTIQPESFYWVPQSFWMVKFRTMFADAREKFPQLYDYDYTGGWKKYRRLKDENDPRVTRVGRWLRRTSLDELPNFWHVLKGELGLVGPRPTCVEMVRNYRPFDMQEFTVRPGVTGLAQINGRGKLTFREIMAYNLEYVRTQSCFLDLKILLLTIKKLFTSEGAH